MERTKQLSQEIRDQARHTVLTVRDVFYIVPPKKYDFYNGGLETKDVTPAAQYYEPFMDGSLPAGHIGVDLEHIYEHVVPAEAIGLSEHERTKIERGLVSLVSIAQRLLQDPDVHVLLEREIADEDKDRLEFDRYDPTQEYLTPASIMRADLLVTEHQSVLCCDPNLVPLGYAICAFLADEVAQETGLAVGRRKDYDDGIIAMIQENENKISGIVTGLNYPNWQSHLGQAAELREQYGVPFYVIPTDCLTEDGTIDVEKLNAFNTAFDIPPYTDENAVPGVLIRYARETQTFHPDTAVVNAPGVRMIETQLWKGLIMLPGFDAICEKNNIDSQELCDARSSIVPTLVMKITEGSLLVATGMYEAEDGYALQWEEVSTDATDTEAQERFSNILVGVHNTNYANNPSEKPKELAWYVKSLSTSGKKGVKLTADGRIEKTAANIMKIAQDYNYNHGGVFLVQPKLRSMIAPDNEEIRTKIDLFISLNTGQTVLIDFMATPRNQRSAHGGSSTKTGLVEW